jgi:hypothetical protein
MPHSLTARVAALVGTFALASTSALAQDAEPDKGQPKQPPTRKEKQRAVEAATAAGAGGKEALGDRGPPKSGKSWEGMTPAEKEEARKRWLLNSGDFGPPGGGPLNAAPKAAEKVPGPKQTVPAK